MKVLVNKYNKESIKEAVKSTKKFICEYCGSELEYEESDMRIGAFGCAYIDCPCCGKNNVLYEEDGITLTKDNVKFPTHFWHTSKETGAVDCCNNEEVKKDIYRAIDYFRNNKDEYHWFTACGNLYVDVSRYEGDESYEIMVTKDYYETSIPFEREDYK